MFYYKNFFIGFLFAPYSAKKMSSYFFARISRRGKLRCTSAPSYREGLSVRSVPLLLPQKVSFASAVRLQAHSQRLSLHYQLFAVHALTREGQGQNLDGFRDKYPTWINRAEF